jgi:tRNA threonylcarbamoyl adenosine modification protein (Sua5/YciO/YrdC/YwlC family)
MTDVVDQNEAIARLRHALVVAVPTDTVYGLAAVLEQPEAIATLFRLKRRPTSVALPVLVGAREAIQALGVEWPAVAARLSDEFWPGALTIVVGVDARLARSVGGVGSIGFRIPHDEVLLHVLSECGPLAVSSANEHRQPPCQSVEQVLEALGSNELLSAVLDGGVRRGEVSTVVEIAQDSWRIIRPGSISAAEIERSLA